MKKLVLLLLIGLFIVAGVLPLYGASPTSPTTIVLTVGSAAALVPGASVWLDVAPFIQDGRTFVPLRLFAEQLGAIVTYTTKGDGTVDQITVQMGGTVAPPLTDGVVILSESSFVSSTGTTHIVGMVQNQTAGPVGLVEVVATFYYAGGQIVGTDSTYIQQGGNVQPGETVPFELVCSQDIPWNHYSLKVVTRTFYKLTTA